MSQTIVIDNIIFQKCITCLVKYPVEKYDIRRKTCDGCRVRARRESIRKFKTKPESEIKRMPKCRCGSLLQKMSVQTHRNHKKIFFYTGFRYCIECNTAYGKEGQVL